jgi:hypothetical protein
MPCTNFIGPITPILIVLAPQAGKLMNTTRIDANKMTHKTLNFFILYPPFPLEDSHCIARAFSPQYHSVYQAPLEFSSLVFL